MQIATTIDDVRQTVAQARVRGLSVGFVPTMGALHEGHARLLRAARAETGFVVASIFVNPTQFGPSEDFHRYPRPFDNDVAVCRAEGVDLIFHPEPAALYPPDYHTYVEVHGLQDVLCGKARPGHFRGVATVVLKLFNIVQPDLAYFGQKDAQQVRLLMQMVRDLNLPVEIRICPIVREPDGLAMSSRNQYLDGVQRPSATVLYEVLTAIQAQIAAGERQAAPLIRLAQEMVARAPAARLDYAEVVSWHTLQPLTELRGDVLIALAVFFGTTRLIDNLRINVGP
jgi:pantoate--beta-alanine ligase